MRVYDLVIELMGLDQNAIVVDNGGRELRVVEQFDGVKTEDEFLGTGYQSYREVGKFEQKRSKLKTIKCAGLGFS